MYLRHFGLREFPFGITPDTSFFFGSGCSQEALNTLLIAVRTGEGFIKITGEVGTGKTLLCRKLMSSLAPDFQVAYIPNPYLDPVALFTELSSELGQEVDLSAMQTQHAVLKGVTNKLLQLARDGKRVVVCLDEAQALPVETLEALRLLTNLETEKRKLLQVIIFGQPELDDKLDLPSIRQLKQRITFDYHLGPLTRSELNYYLHHRLMVAGYCGGRLFDTLATRLLQYTTKRIPRLVNIVAHKALLSAYGKGNRSVGVFDVLSASRDTGSLRKSAAGGVRMGISLVLLGICLTAFGWVMTL